MCTTWHTVPPAATCAGFPKCCSEMEVGVRCVLRQPREKVGVSKTTKGASFHVPRRFTEHWSHTAFVMVPARVRVSASLARRRQPVAHDEKSIRPSCTNRIAKETHTKLSSKSKRPMCSRTSTSGVAHVSAGAASATQLESIKNNRPEPHLEPVSVPSGRTWGVHASNYKERLDGLRFSPCRVPTRRVARLHHCKKARACILANKALANRARLQTKCTRKPSTLRFMAEPLRSIALVVKHGAKEHALGEIELSLTVGGLRLILESLTDVPRGSQKMSGY